MGEAREDAGTKRCLEHDTWYRRPHVLRDAYKRVGMKDQALAALTHILVRCTDYRYDVLEVFSVGEVCSWPLYVAMPDLRQEFVTSPAEAECATKLSWRNAEPCFAKNGLNLGAFTLYVETFLADYDPLTKDQQVLHLEIVEMQSHTSNNFSIYLLVATNFKVFLLEPNPEKPAYAAEIGERWDPNWETLFPRQPLVVWEREYSSLVRIWRCYGSQILAVEWQGAGKRLSDAEESSPGSGQEIQYEVYLFHLADCRDVMADCLRAYAASKDVKGEGPPVLTDPSFRNIVIGQTKEDYADPSRTARRTRPR
ncbi:TSR3 [Symbiodinium sp. CCMP2592]|nr:TSR3 [Symbiodinium sp. CCMP2592]